VAFIPCPKCRSKLQVSTSTTGKVRCPNCEAIFSPNVSTAPNRAQSDKQSTKSKPEHEVIEAELEAEDEVELPRKKLRLRNADDEGEPTARKKLRNRVDEDEDDEPIARRKRRAVDDEDEDDDEDNRPRRSRKKRKKKSNDGVLMWAFIGGGVLFLVLGLGVVAYFVSRSSSDPSVASDDFSDSSNPFAGIGPSTSTDANDFSGRWQEFDRLNNQGDKVILHIAGIKDQGTASAIEERIDFLTPKGNFSRGGLTFLPKMAVSLSPVRNPEEFAKKIDFGRVLSVKGNIILIAADKLEGPPAEPFARAIHDLKIKNDKRYDSALNTLIQTPPDERRSEVLKILEPLTGDQYPLLHDKATEAFCKWATKDNVPVLLRLINASEPGARVKAAMKTMAKLKDERGIAPIAARLKDFFVRGEAKEALIAYGPMAEDEVIKLLRQTNNDARNEACEILEKIGTAKSLPVLEQAAQDFFLKGNATRAIEAIKKRL
jgi:hypothetical protein